MTDEILLKDRLEIERRRDDFARLDRINASERDIAVLKTLFDATTKSILEKLEGAVSDDDLKTLKRELEDYVKEAISAIRESLDRSNETWAKEILNGSSALMDRTRLERLEEQRKYRGQIVMVVIASALSVIGSLFVFYLTTGRP